MGDGDDDSIIIIDGVSSDAQKTTNNRQLSRGGEEETIVNYRRGEEMIVNYHVEEEENTIVNYHWGKEEKLDTAVEVQWLRWRCNPLVLANASLLATPIILSQSFSHSLNQRSRIH